jgi:hypothetical protein
MNVTAWTDTQIDIAGFGGGEYYGGPKKGDRILVLVWNPQNGKGPAVYVTIAK